MPLSPLERCIASVGINPRPFREHIAKIVDPLQKCWKATSDVCYDLGERVQGREPVPVRIRDAFYRFDGDGNGHVDSLELKLALGNLGFRLDHEQATSILQRYDDDNNETLELEEFHKLVKDFEGIGSKKVEEATLEDNDDSFKQQQARNARLAGEVGEAPDVRRLSMYIEEGVTGYTPRDEDGFMQSRRESTGSELVTFLKDLGVTMKSSHDR